MNIIRADTYRILRSKGFYITLAIFIAVIVLQIVAGTGIYSGVTFEVAVVTEEIYFETLDYHDLFAVPTGAQAPFHAMAASHNILFIILPLLVFIGTSDFTSGTVKNVLASGVSRARYFFAKLILSCIVCALLLFFNVLLSTITATVISGFGGTLDGAFIASVLKVFLAQLWLCLAITCVGHFFTFTLRSSGALIGVYIAFLLVPSMLILLLTQFNEWFTRLYDYDLTIILIEAAVAIESMSGGDIAKMLLVGVGYIAATVIGGFLLFRKAEIKK